MLEPKVVRVISMGCIPPSSTGTKYIYMHIAVVAAVGDIYICVYIYIYIYEYI
jgi:hypothetical protein